MSGRPLIRIAKTSLTLLLLVCGCSGGAERPGPPAFDPFMPAVDDSAVTGDDVPAEERSSEEAADAGAEDESCSPGHSRKCTVYLGEHAGVKTCFVFDQWCEDGKWGDCGADKPSQKHDETGE